MGGKPAHLVVAVLLTMLATTLATGASLTMAGPTVAKSKTTVSCPKKIGGFRLYRTEQSEGTASCTYGRRNWTRKDGDVYLRVQWHPDDPANRTPCKYRSPEEETAFGGGVLYRVYDRDRYVYGWYIVSEGRRVTRRQAEAALHKLLGATAPLAQVCLPEAEPLAQDALACPLVIGDYVRSDWYGDDPPAVEPLEGGGDGRRYRFTCRYRINAMDERAHSKLTLTWWEGTADHRTGRALCRMESEDDGSATRTVADSHPVHSYIDNDLAAAGGQRTVERLIGVLAKRTAPCPGSGGESAPAAADSSKEGPSNPAGTTTATIVLSGGPDEEPPPIGTPIDLPEGEGHRIFIGDPEAPDDAVAIGSLGEQGEVVGYGPMARDAEGNWTVSVEVRVTPVSEPQPEPAEEPDAESQPEPEPAVEPEPGPAVEPQPEPEPEPVVAPEPQPEPEAETDPELGPEDVLDVDDLLEEPQPEQAVEPEPDPQPEAPADPMAVAREAATELIDDLGSQLDAAKMTDGGVIVVGAELFDELAGLDVVADRLAVLKLGDGKIELETRTKKPDEEPWVATVRPIEVDGKLDIAVTAIITEEFFGKKVQLPIPIPIEALDFLDPKVPALVEDLKARINGEVDGRGLMVEDALVTTGGIGVAVVPKVQE